MPKKVFEDTLATAPYQGKHLVEPLKTLAQSKGFPAKILEDVAVSNPAEVHRLDGDLWHCLGGEVEFVCGGVLINPTNDLMPDGSPNENELKASAISGGTRYMLRPGDWLWIPPGEPHQHGCAEVGRLVVIKIPSKT